MRIWKCVDVGWTSGFTEGNVYEVGEDGIIHYDSGNECQLIKFVINGNKAKCWDAKFEEVKGEKENKMKFKVGDRVVVNGRRSLVDFKNEKGKIVLIDRDGDIGVEFDNGKDEFHDCLGNGRNGHCWYVYENMCELVKPSTKSIHLTFDGTTTHAIVKEGGKVVNRVKVGLCRGDVYDEATGIREVIDKLYGKKVEMKTDVKPREFKVGDKVVILDGSGIDNYCGDWASSMNEYIGKIATIETFDSIDSMDGVRFKEFSYVWDLRGIRLASEAPVKTPPSEYTIDELLAEIKERCK